jgi:hypothetical protein
MVNHHGGFWDQVERNRLKAVQRTPVSHRSGSVFRHFALDPRAMLILHATTSPRF